MSRSLKGVNVCFTGTFPDFTRAELEDMAKEYGFTFQPNVTRKTTILVAAPDAGKTKVDKAREYGVKIWTPEDFLLMLTQDDSDGIPPPVHKPTQEEKVAHQSYYEAREDVGIF